MIHRIICEGVQRKRKHGGAGERSDNWSEERTGGGRLMDGRKSESQGECGGTAGIRQPSLS